jgi:lipopolysaccharide transport system ATP-binding protein
MSSDIAISVKNIGKCYEIYSKPHHRLFQTLLHGRKQFYKEFWALQNISFEVKKGECVGIIGRNGCGKSTLLQVIAGTLATTTGSAQVNGRVAALLELGSGFNPEFTGRENIYMNGTVLGLSHKAIDDKFADIVAFADIGEFIDQPVKTYSSGMMVRLAFAVVAHVDADVLIIDEALAVGDAFFVQKCMRFIRKFMETKTVLFVSHDTAAVVNLCDRVIMLEQGEVKYLGNAKEVTEKYLEDIYAGQNVTENNDETVIVEQLQLEDATTGFRDMRLDFINSTNLRNDLEIFKFIPDADSFGTGNAKIVKVEFIDKNKMPLSWVIGGELVTIKIAVKCYQTMTSPIIGFCIKDKLGQYLFGDNSFFTYYKEPVIVSAGDLLEGSFTFYMPRLQNGDYSLNVAIANGTQEEHVQHHWIHDALFFRAHAKPAFLGLLALPMKNIILKIKLKT